MGKRVAVGVGGLVVAAAMGTTVALIHGRGAVAAIPAHTVSTLGRAGIDVSAVAAPN